MEEMEKVDIKELLKELGYLKENLEEKRAQISERLEKIEKLESEKHKETLGHFPAIKRRRQKHRIDSLNKELSEVEKEINEIIESEKEARKGDTRKAEEILKAKEVEVSALSQALIDSRLL